WQQHGNRPQLTF
nr:immunoglobulin light chain junction region [Macaca mulatta]MPO02650.1 immunoglobulin light chain junction region [Macaca mulatta]